MSATRSLAAYVASANTEDLPPSMLHEAKRTLVNILAVSLSASADSGSHALIDWARDEGAAPKASVVGSSLRTSAFNAAMVNGFLAHLQDYDDTHFPTVLHPTAPVWPAVLAVAEERGTSGRDTLAAFVLGAEAACRVAMSVHPWHYDMGWHITGTAGVFGAAAGAGRVLGLGADDMNTAIGIAGTFAAGVREVFGSHAKAMHPAKAASNGVQSARLATQGFTGADDILGGRRGFWQVLSPNGHSEEALLAGLGSRWELANNGLKPYANGVVSHPIQDAVITLRNEHGIAPEDVASIDAEVNPLVLELMNRAEPRRGLEGKFSFQHCAAAALVDGAGHDVAPVDDRRRAAHEYQIRIATECLGQGVSKLCRFVRDRAFFGYCAAEFHDPVADTGPGQLQKLGCRVGKGCHHMPDGERPERCHGQQSLGRRAGRLDVAPGHGKGNDLDRRDEVTDPDSRPIGQRRNRDGFRNQVAALHGAGIDLDEAVGRRHDIDAPAERLANLGACAGRRLCERGGCRVFFNVVGAEPGHRHPIDASLAQGVDVGSAQYATFAESGAGHSKRMSQYGSFAVQGWLQAEFHRQLAAAPPRRTLTTWARMAAAISAGARAPIASPTGPWIRAISESEKPSRRRRLQRAACVRVLPSEPTKKAGLRSATPRAASSSFGSWVSVITAVRESGPSDSIASSGHKSTTWTPGNLAPVANALRGSITMVSNPASTAIFTSGWAM